MNKRMESFEKNNLSTEQIEQKEKFVELLDLISSISERADSNIAEDFIEFMDENGLKFRDYFLADLFSAMVRKDKLPEQGEYKFYDTEDKKIENFIRSLALIESA